MDLTSLCVVPGRTCWVVHVDGLLLNDGGNALDALSIATRLALSLTRIPKVSSSVTMMRAQAVTSWAPAKQSWSYQHSSMCDCHQHSCSCHVPSMQANFVVHLAGVTVNVVQADSKAHAMFAVAVTYLRTELSQVEVSMDDDDEPEVELTGDVGAPLDVSRVPIIVSVSQVSWISRHMGMHVGDLFLACSKVQ